MKKSFEEFSVAGKNQGMVTVLLSLFASVIGASATLGIAEKTAAQGESAIWFLLAGCAGLLFQGLILSSKIRALNADTLPDLAEKTIGRQNALFISIIIFISWTGIVAAQFVALAGLVSSLLPVDASLVLIIAGAAVTAYTMTGGQGAVVKTDRIHALFIFLGIAAAFAYCAFSADGAAGADALQADDVLFSDDAFSRFLSGVTPVSLLYLVFIVGGTYFLGPDIISRNLISRDAKTAKRAVLISSAVLLVFAFLVVETSAFGARALKASDALPAGVNPLVALITGFLPLPLAIILAVALIAALISSADTCLVNAATIFEYNVLGRKRVGEIRILIALMGVAAVLLGLGGRGIMTLLVGAYSIYSPGVVLPLTIGILCHEKRRIRPRLMFVAILLGSVCGLIAQFAPLPAVSVLGGSLKETLPLIGMALSGVVSLFACL
ncbi:MAG: hypothetical protein KBT02_00905 [Treponema sp.]|nr:hypothetical protein [Candidatus Treponema caballi]